MGKFFHKFRMDWCLVWNSVYDGSIASAINIMVSSTLYVGICGAIVTYALHFSGPPGVPLGNEYREVIRHGDELFRHGHEDGDKRQVIHSFSEARVWLHKKEREGELMASRTSEMPNWIQKIIEDARRKAQLDDMSLEVGEEHGHNTEDPLLSPHERDLLVFPSMIMLVFGGINIIVSAILLTAIIKRVVAILLLWSVFFLPLAIGLDNIYQIYLFYLLLTMGPLWAHTGSVWFEIFVVLNLIFWIVRNLSNLYTFFCITAYRNASTQRRQRFTGSIRNRRRMALRRGTGTKNLKVIKTVIEKKTKASSSKPTEDEWPSSSGAVSDDEDDEQGPVLLDDNGNPSSASLVLEKPDFLG